MVIRSLRSRWILALVAVCLLEALLVAVAVRLTTTHAFQQFIIEESFDVFVASATAEARTTGALTSNPPRVGPHSRQGGPPPPRARPGRGARDERRPSPASQGGDINFGLADASGYVLRPFDTHAAGDQLTDDDLETGRPIIVDNVHVGTAFIPRNAADALEEFPASSPEARFIASASDALAVALALALAVALAVGAWLAGLTVQPLRTLTSAARAIASGQLRQSVEVHRADEIGALADAFNTMSMRLDEATALRRQMTANVSHDLRTPVTAVLGTLELIETGVLEPTPQRIRAARVEAKRLSRLIESFHTLALVDAGELPIHVTRIRTTEALQHTATSFEAQATTAGITIRVATDEAPDLYADPDRLAQVLANLLANALRYTPAGGQITLQAGHVPDGVTIAVTDTGSGIPPDVVPHVFERAVRADAARSGQGAGLGLSIVRSLVEAMHGAVQLDSILGEGTTVRLTLPAADSLLSPAQTLVAHGNLD